MDGAPLPFCMICGDPRLVAWGIRSSDPDDDWSEYACGHGTSRSEGSADLAGAKWRHPSGERRTREAPPVPTSGRKVIVSLVR